MANETTTNPLMDDEALRDVLHDAIDAFFASLESAYPECPTGDFPPDADETFWKAAWRAAQVWIEENHPHFDGTES